MSEERRQRTVFVRASLLVDSWDVASWEGMVMRYEKVQTNPEALIPDNCEFFQAECTKKFVSL
ncbi:hypothetical protein TC41_0027 [Alicyclobacillus acidocaldarius subsp. acidocaldarius Tc-4-1]|uniref:Uncharacterized protein n=1 Tax=Alicyclobacillus acidocaldarius (strain Tc-4-1) TaxID=1048834 RepID=F8IHP0_ALIAT|nr:hypothetical protein TC41_0027 [Alicyclobacillus acidocaldarius subsp. acidocaldarius Tc-4-1]